MTPAQSEAEQAEPTDAQNTVNASAFEAVAREQSRGERSPRDSFRRGTPAPPNKTLYVGNLYYEVTPDQLERIFSRFGEVVSVNVVKDNRGMSRGFAYVEYSNLDDAQNAISNLNQQVFEGRNLIVQPHVQKERPGRTYEPKEPNAPSKTLFIGNMSFNMTDKDLNDLFREIRNVVDVRVAIDRRTGQPRGFAHADFVDVASAVKAFETLQGKSFHGRELRLDYTQSATRAPRTDRSENGGNRFHDRRDNDRRDNNRQGGFGRE
jgi:RNA recognition motif-containing protein